MHRRSILAALLCTCIALPAAAQERGTRDEAKTMVDAAFEHMKKVGADKALKDFTTDKATWTKKDLYVFVFDTKGAFLAHGANDKLVGRDMSAMKDPNGKAIFPAMMEVAASKGSGWVDYDWAHPQTKKVEGKSSYVRKAPAGDGLIGVGIYR
jgi:cytochrome c